MFLIHVFLYAGVYCIYRPCNQNSVGGGGGGGGGEIDVFGLPTFAIHVN